MPDPTGPPVPYQHPPREWIIDQVLPRRIVALLVGPPGVSKTTAAIQWLAEIRSGNPVFGRRTFPTEIAFVSCDRSQEEHEEHMRALGYDPGIFHFHDQVNSRTSVERVVKACASRYPSAGLIFVDGFARLLPNGQPNNYSEVADFLCECGLWARTLNRTIMGCLHAGKVREGQSYLDPRDNVCGSTAWAGFSNLMIVMQKANPKLPSDPIRDVHIMTRAGSGDFSFKLAKNPDRGGFLSPWTDPVEDDLLTLVSYWLAKQEFDRLIPKREFVEQGKDASVSQRMIERWLAEQIEAGRLTRIKLGLYQRVRMQ